MTRRGPIGGPACRRWTALHLAAANNHGEVVELLLASGASTGSRNEHARTPLHLASFHDRLEVTWLLLEAGADPNAQARAARTLYGAPRCDRLRPAGAGRVMR